MRLWAWILSALIVAGVVHTATIHALPGVIMDRLMTRVSDNAGINTLVHNTRVDATSRLVVRPSSDLLYSLCAFDLTNGRLTLTAPVPDSYWSVALYTDNTDTFFMRNDRQVPNGQLSLTVLPPTADIPLRPADGSFVVRAPSEKGVVLFRTLITSDRDLERLDTLRRQATCSGPFIAP